MCFAVPIRIGVQPYFPLLAPPVPLTISPDDRFVIIPAGTVIALVSLSDRTARTFRNVVAPAAFTPDSSTLVLEVQPSNEGAHLEFVDIASGSSVRDDIPLPGAFAYFTTSEDHAVLVSGLDSTDQSAGTPRFFVVDRDAHTVTMPTGTGNYGLSLNQFVVRTGHHETWIRDDQVLRCTPTARSRCTLDGTT